MGSGDGQGSGRPKSEPLPQRKPSRHAVWCATDFFDHTSKSLPSSSVYAVKRSLVQRCDRLLEVNVLDEIRIDHANY